MAERVKVDKNLTGRNWVGGTDLEGTESGGTGLGGTESAQPASQGEIRDLTARIERLEEAGQVGTWHLDLRSTRIEVSPWLQRTLEIPVSFDFDVALNQFFSAADAESIVRVMAEAAAEAMPFTIVTQVEVVDGRVVSGRTAPASSHPDADAGEVLGSDDSLDRMWFRHRGEPQRDTVGGLVGYIGVSQRIDHEVRAGAERNAFHQTLQRVQRDEAGSYLAGGLAHEVSNLLQPALLMCGMAAAAVAVEDSERATQYIERVETAIRRSAEVVSSTLELARVDSEELVPVSLRAMVRDLEIFLDPHLLGRVQWEIPDEIHALSFLATRAGVVQVSLNLLKNASEASPGGEPITLQARVEARVSPAREMIVLEFCDHGSGFTAEALTRAFDPRFTTRFGTTGNGLGLAVVRTMVERWGGNVSLSNRTDGGACVSLRVPVVGAES